MGQFLQELGLRTESNRNFGAVGLRWAAMKAGLGIVRKNNFFYTESGSSVSLEAWITDRDMELIESSSFQACPKGCSACISSCPTGSLSSPYAMNPVACVSFLTTFGARDLTGDPLGARCGSWIYGCDACQDVCPFNRDKWIERDELPAALEIAPRLTPESILEMDEKYYKDKIQPLFFYLSPDELWKWKVNVLNFMRNNYQENYGQCIAKACSAENETVRKMAQKIFEEMALPPCGTD